MKTPRPREWWISETNQSKGAKMRLAVYQVYLKHRDVPGMIPTNGRFIYYELLHDRPDLVKKHEAPPPGQKEKRSDQPVNVALTELREHGLIPWEDIVDETRELTEWPVFPSVEDGMRDRWEDVRVSFWHPQRPPLILCESRSLAGVLANLAWEFQCPITSTNGQCAGHLRRLARWLKRGDRILLFGDWDKGGKDIEANNRKVLDEIRPGLIWEKIAITEAQIKKYNLQLIWKKDGREKGDKLRPAVETEALGQDVIIDLLRTRLEELRPKAQRERVLRREKRDRKEWGRTHGWEEEEE